MKQVSNVFFSLQLFQSLAPFTSSCIQKKFPDPYIPQFFFLNQWVTFQVSTHGPDFPKISFSSANSLHSAIIWLIPFLLTRIRHSLISSFPCPCQTLPPNLASSSIIIIIPPWFPGWIRPHLSPVRDSKGLYVLDVNPHVSLPMDQSPFDKMWMWRKILHNNNNKLMVYEFWNKDKAWFKSTLNCNCHMKWCYMIKLLSWRCIKYHQSAMWGLLTPSGYK